MSLKSVLIGSIVLVLLLLIASRTIAHKKYKAWKKPLFILIAVTIIVPSLVMTGSTIVLNTISDSKGPVHWHTDIEFWVCGEEIEFRNPSAAFSNKIGTSTFHEHDDKRIHLEGVVIDRSVDASLSKFMNVTGGEITSTSLSIPTESSIFEDDTDGDALSGERNYVRQYTEQDSDGKSIVKITNGNRCNDTLNAEVQTFLYTFNKVDNTYSQIKLSDPSKYDMRDESIVPPGDCVIVEFDARKDRTDKLCQQFGVRDARRCVDFGVEKHDTKLCNIREITNFEEGSL